MNASEIISVLKSEIADFDRKTGRSIKKRATTIYLLRIPFALRQYPILPRSSVQVLPQNPV